jgi:tetratricopeptide (TPR) repeat protein
VKVVATVLIGPGTEDQVHKAVNSARHLADEFVLIDTRKPEDMASIHGQFEVKVARMTVEYWPWTGHYDDARNAALEFARKCGADWALTLDTDERLNGIKRSDMLGALARPGVDVWLVADNHKRYTKERFIRLSSGPVWIGWTHEGVHFNKGVDGDRVALQVQRGVLPGVFWEAEKTPKQLDAKAERDASILKAYIQAGHANECRWWRYLGESLFHLKCLEQAREAFTRAFRLDDQFREERAWACIRAAECSLMMGQFERAYDCAVFALSLHPGYAREVGWLCAYCADQNGWRELALEWSLIGIRNEPPKNRIGFSNPMALSCAWGMARRSYALMGDNEAAAHAAEQERLTRPEQQASRSPEQSSPAETLAP